MSARAPLAPLPRLRPVTEDNAVPARLSATCLLARLLASPVPVTAKVSPFTPVAVRYWPAKVVPPSYTRVPESVRSALAIVSMPSTKLRL